MSRFDDATVEALQNCLDELEGKLKLAEETVEKIGKRIDELTRWRDPKTELPQTNDAVLVWVEGLFDIGWYHPDRETWNFAKNRRFKPDAWMPLQPTPKKAKPT